MDPVTLQTLIGQYSALAQVLVKFGKDIYTGLKALLGAWHTELTEDERTQILDGIMANSEVREALARAESGESGTIGQPQG